MERIDSLPLVEKYRPIHLEGIISQNDIIENIMQLLDNGKLPHLLFYGSSGSGKTTTIIACARRLYGKHYKSMILELNGSDDRGINVIRDQIKEFAGTEQPLQKGIKLIILDEADSMTYDAQFALRRVMELYTYNTRFCLICNYLNKIIPAIKSRCTQFRFSPIDDASISTKLQEVCEYEGIPFTIDGINATIKLGEGDMRKCYNLLQSTYMSFQTVTETSVYNCTGDPLPSDIDKMFKYLMTSEFNTCYDHIMKIKAKKGLALVDIIKYLTEKVELSDILDTKKSVLFIHMADIECKLSLSSLEFLQLGALVSCFILIR